MSDVEHHAFASPLALLDEWRGLEDGPPLREMVVLGFTHDLPFLERFAVSAARQLGARLTVLADGGQARHDVVDVRFAGHAYQYGVTATRGAFHPKLVVLLGDEHVWLAVGSGNPTMSGWGHNRELWCILRGTIAAGLRAQADLGAWLASLARYVPMPSWIATTLAEVGARIVPDLIDDQADVRLLHNLTEPILDELPGTAREVNLAAPFFDPSGEAVRAVVARSRPERVRVAIQPGLTSFDGRALTDALREIPVEFRAVDDQRTMHGKLLEYIDGHGSTIAVVGSPNVTSAALLRSVEGGGNCELAVVAPVGRSLLPEATTLSAADVVAATPPAFEPQSDAVPALRLLGCRRTEDGLDLELVANRRVDVSVETSTDGAPGSWSRRAVVPRDSLTLPGTTLVSIVVPESVGARVRLVADLDGRRVVSSTAFVTDPRRCRARTDVGDTPALRRDYALEDVITDENLLRRFGRDLMTLLDLSAKARTAASTPLRAATGAQATGRDGAGDPWTRLLDLTAYSLGASLVDLAFPGALPSPSAIATSSSWSLEPIADETELAEGETEEVIDQPNAAPVPRQAPHVAPSARSQYRSWIGRWVRAISRDEGAPPLPLRMTVAGLVLELLAAGVYERDDGWRDVLADAVTSLVHDTDEIAASPPEMHGYLGSLVAVGMAVLLQDATLHGGRPCDVLAQRVWESSHAVAATAQEPLVEELLLRSTQDHARLAAETEVNNVITLARGALADPHAEVLAGFEADGLEIDRRDGVWQVRGRFRNPLPSAARIATELDTSDGVVGVAVAEGRTAIVVRRRTNLAMFDSVVGRWRLYEVRRPSTPSSFLGRGEVPTAKRTYPGLPVPPAVADLVTGIDLDEVVREHAPGARRR